ncbi:uncharacterized protein LOC132733254 [Ruditapes philippinarum]|uniref:uncharacterized protein LOC132733254 n=1 Tax=Ruditapes philippinarum TaxID=129788 RepID=UPI00295C0E0B|nr:uncharacterized protein LOC132733254 [Ruditapes philippinarum]
METAGNIAQQFTPTLGQYVSGFGIKPNAIDKTLRIYAAKCVELCWLMAVCDPPMALSEDKIGNPYDFNIYKPYTRSMKDLKNPVLKLAIWPALRLHLGGSLVAKGVAQPGEGKSKQ